MLCRDCSRDREADRKEVLSYTCSRGGANAAYLNELTAKETGMTVYAGPGEATAIGNIASQMIAAKELYDLKAARQCIFDSFEIKEYCPD